MGTEGENSVKRAIRDPEVLQFNHLKERSRSTAKIHTRLEDRSSEILIKISGDDALGE